MCDGLSRRRFLQGTGAAGIALAAGLPAAAEDEARAAAGAPHAEKLGWRLGCASWSFNRFSFRRAVEKTASLGLAVIEAYSGHRLGEDEAEGSFGLGMSAAARQEILGFLADHGVELVNFYYGELPNDEAGSRAVFEFAREMGIETIVSEPRIEALDLIEPLAEEYAVNVALHNHPPPTRYWDPRTVREACAGRGPRIGACGDTGHWMRSEIKPIEAVRLLEGRLLCFHFKDLNRFGSGAHDVPWGTGAADVPAVLRECHRQGFRGVFAAEYEHNWLESLPEIAASVEFFDQVAAEIRAM